MANRSLVKHSLDARTFCFDMGPKLKSTETLTGTPTIAARPDGLTISTIAVNTSIFTDVDGTTTVAADEGVQALISGGAPGQAYALRVSAATDGGETVAETFHIKVE